MFKCTRRSTTACSCAYFIYSLFPIYFRNFWVLVRSIFLSPSRLDYVALSTVLWRMTRRHIQLYCKNYLSLMFVKFHLLYSVKLYFQHYVFYSPKMCKYIFENCLFFYGFWIVIYTHAIYFGTGLVSNNSKLLLH